MQQIFNLNVLQQKNASTANILFCNNLLFIYLQHQQKQIIMETNLTPQQEQEAVNHIYEYAADLFINKDKNSYEVKMALVAKGMSEENAQIVVDRLEDEIEQARKRRANKDMLWGAVWCIGGTIVTIATYSAASNGGGRYVVAWGAIIFGGVQFIRGVIASTK